MKLFGSLQGRLLHRMNCHTSILFLGIGLALLSSNTALLLETLKLGNQWWLNSLNLASWFVILSQIAFCSLHCSCSNPPISKSKLRDNTWLFFSALGLYVAASLFFPAFFPNGPTSIVALAFLILGRLAPAVLLICLAFLLHQNHKQIV